MAQRDMELALRIHAELAQARREIAGLRRDLTGTGESGKKAGRDLRGMNRELSESEALMRRNAAQARALRQALGGITVALLFRQIVTNTARQAEAMADLEAAVRSTGGAAGFTAEELARMAGELQRVTTFGDESIMEMQAVLLTFKNVTGAVFQDSSELILDMATRLKTDLKSAALQAGKALNDPVGGIEALTGAGIQFDDSQKSTIKRLVEVGDVLGAQQIILAELRSQFGGAARAARDNFGGALKGLRNVVGDLLEGGDSLPGATKAIEGLTQALSDPTVQQGIRSLVDAVIKLTAAVAELLTLIPVSGVRIGEFFAELAAGPGGSARSIQAQIESLQDRIAEIDDDLGRPRIFRVDVISSTDDLRQERARIEAEIAKWQEMLSYWQRVAQPAAPAGAGAPAAPAAPVESEAFLKAQADLRRRIDLLGRETAAQQMLWEVEQGRYKDLAQNEKDALVALARRLDAGTEARRQADEDARAAEAARTYVEQLERQAATLGLNAAQVRAYELAEKNLTGALRARASAALQAIAADEQRRQADTNARTNAGLEAEYLRAIGRTTDAAVVEMNSRFAQMRREMIESGNQAGLAWIERLIPVNQARIRLDEVQRQIEAAFAAQSRGEQSIEAQVSAGLITQLEGRRRLVELHRETANVVQTYLPALREMAALPGPMGEQARAALETLETQLIRLRTTTNELQNALRNGLQSGIEEALTGLANGTKNLEEAVRSLLQNVAQAMAQLAAQRLAEMATDSVMGLFGGAGGTAAAAATQAAAAQLAAAGSTVTAGAGALGTSSATLSAAAGMLPAGAAAVQAAAVQLQAAATTMGAVGSASSAAGAGFAAGGHVRGPGTGTSDSIPAWLSDFEFVTRASVVRQPGALSFLHDFNRRGMSALEDWARRVRHATGGVAGIPAPVFAAPTSLGAQLAEPAKLISPTLDNRTRIFNLFDIEDIARRVTRTRVFEREVVNVVGSNPMVIQERTGG